MLPNMVLSKPNCLSDASFSLQQAYCVLILQKLLFIAAFSCRSTTSNHSRVSFTDNVLFFRDRLLFLQITLEEK